MQKFVLPENANIDEVADTLGDFFETMGVVEDRLSDGVQWLPDLIAIAGQEDEVRDMIESFPTFLEQFQKLTPETAQTALSVAVDRVAAKVGKPGKITMFTIQIFTNATSNFAFAKKVMDSSLEIFNDAKVQWEQWKELFDKDDEQAPTISD